MALEMALPFANRNQAGRELGEALKGTSLERPVVLGVPRGGVAVAAPVAEMLGGDLDVVVVRKLGAPGNPELGIGAVGAWGDPWLDEGLIARLGVPERFIEAEIADQRAEAQRRVATYRGDMPPTHIQGRDVVVVDDGIATGGTVTAAAQLLRASEPRRLVLAVPVAPAEAVVRMLEIYDETCVPHTPKPYHAVGQWYQDFHQVSDEEVRSLLSR